MGGVPNVKKVGAERVDPFRVGRIRGGAVRPAAQSAPSLKLWSVSDLRAATQFEPLRGSDADRNKRKARAWGAPDLREPTQQAARLRAVS
jgi:hypothetical protein